MPAEVLVMCSKCGHPQSAPLPQCVRCGATLPVLDFMPTTDPLAPTSASQVTSAPNAPASAEDPVFWHADLGKGRVLALTRKRLGFREGGKAKSFDLEKLSGVSLIVRPTVAGLFIAAASVAGWFFVGHPFVRGAVLVAGIVGLLAFFFRRTYQLHVRTREGADVQWPMGVGTLRAPDSARIGRIWDSLRGELEKLGVADPSKRSTTDAR